MNWRHHTCAAGQRGFTLVELLVVVGIIALLLGILIPALTSAQKQARTVVELSAARQLMAAFQLYAHDNRGRVLPGYGPLPAADEFGNPIPAPANSRYPWRLVPYLNKVFRGAILVNEQEQRLGVRDTTDLAGWTYTVSVFPSFGMNIEGVGGNLAAYTPNAVRRLGEPSNPTDLIVFASARYNTSGYEYGYFEVRRPQTDTFNESDLAFQFGFVHPRHRGRAVVGLFDGHAELLDAKQLYEENRWKNASVLAAAP